MSDEAASDEAAGKYDEAEKTYLEALATGADEPRLRSLASDLAESARSWEVADNQLAPLPPGIQRYYDLPEVLSSLWADIVAAYEQRAR